MTSIANLLAADSTAQACLPVRRPLPDVSTIRTLCPRPSLTVSLTKTGSNLGCFLHGDLVYLSNCSSVLFIRLWTFFPVSYSMEKSRPNLDTFFFAENILCIECFLTGDHRRFSSQTYLLVPVLVSDLSD